MRITLDVIRKVLRRGLGAQCFTAGFIRRVEEDPDQSSAYITRDGCLRYNPRFVEEHISCPEDLFSLLLHELLHPLWAHFLRCSGELENIAADAVINAAISTLYRDSSAKGSLFQNLYPPQGLEALLRPQSQLGSDVLGRVYGRLYPESIAWPTQDHMEPTHPLTTGELVRSLKILLPADGRDPVPLLGSHRSEAEDDEPGEDQGQPWERGDLSQVARDLKDGLQVAEGSQPGCGSELHDLLFQVLESHMGLRDDVLMRFATQRRADRFLERKRLEWQSRVSPLPLYPTRRDAVLLAEGIDSLHYHQLTGRETVERQGVAIYLDVSGSVASYLPEIIGVLNRLRGRLASIYQFSTEVVETSLEDLLAGSIQTTYGTDFDCVAQSILEQSFERSIVITDGCAQLSANLRDELLQKQAKMLTVLFGQAQGCPPLAPLGDVVPLQEVCHRRMGARRKEAE